MRLVNVTAGLIDAGQEFIPGRPVDVDPKFEEVLKAHIAEGGILHGKLVVDDGKVSLPPPAPVTYSVAALEDGDALKRISAEKDKAVLASIVENDEREEVVSAAKARLKKIGG